MRLGKQEPIKDSFLLNSTVVILFTTPKKIIPDIEDTIAKKTAKKKKALLDFQCIKIICESHYHYKAYLKPWY